MSTRFQVSLISCVGSSISINYSRILFPFSLSLFPWLPMTKVRYNKRLVYLRENYIHSNIIREVKGLHHWLRPSITHFDPNLEYRETEDPDTGKVTLVLKTRIQSWVSSSKICHWVHLLFLEWCSKTNVVVFININGFTFDTFRPPVHIF